MRFKGLDLNLLMALDVMLEERSVSAAGRRLFLSQSAASGALSRLREHFNDELLIPVGRRMAPTPFAEGLMEPLRDLMLRIDATVSPGQAFDPATTRRTFRIGCSDYITEVVISRLVPLIAERAPGAVLDVVAPGSDQPGSLDSGEVDILIMPEFYMAPGHPYEPLYDERHVVVAWEGNTLLADGRMDEERFRSLGHVVVRFARIRASSLAETWMDTHVPERRIELIAPAFIHVPRMLVGTQRIAITHERLARMQADVLPIRLFEPPFDIPPVREVVQSHRARRSDGGLRWMIDQIRDSVSGLARRR
ncbi:LysR family transcriptional regulator [Brevundimonas sp.]|uniref:LysR family transcriptional regulator n=1 Tax=Brevundimonas sp. TaxID=1871086 RepID=UPI003D0AEFBF